MKKTAAKVSRGRPRTFDRDVALGRAQELFWRRGFEATSIHDLTEAMGITPPSLYAAFGDKERLFMEAVERYIEHPRANLARIFDEAPSAKEAMARLLKERAQEMVGSEHPRGCMLVTSAMNCSESSSHLQDALAKIRTETAKVMRERIQRDIDDTLLSEHVDAGELAQFYDTVLQGMTIKARDGASAKQLRSIASAAMRAWPE